jgi:hypothetical protein
MFELQDEIAARVAGAVEPKLLFAEAGLAQVKPTEDQGAYDLVLRALPHVYRVQTLEDFRKGVALLDQAIARDPDYAMAKAWKVRAYLIARGARMISWDENLEAAPLPKALLAEAGDDPLVLVFAGQFHAFSGWGQEEGTEAVRRARRMCPNSALVNLSAGWPLSYVGAYDEADRGVRGRHPARPAGRHGGLLPDGGVLVPSLCRAGGDSDRDHGTGLPGTARPTARAFRP